MSAGQGQSNYECAEFVSRSLAAGAFKSLYKSLHIKSNLVTQVATSPTWPPALRNLLMETTSTTVSPMTCCGCPASRDPLRVLRIFWLFLDGRTKEPLHPTSMPPALSCALVQVVLIITLLSVLATMLWMLTMWRGIRSLVPSTPSMRFTTLPHKRKIRVVVVVKLACCNKLKVFIYSTIPSLASPLRTKI